MEEYCKANTVSSINFLNEQVNLATALLSLHQIGITVYLKFSCISKSVA